MDDCDLFNFALANYSISANCINTIQKANYICYCISLNNSTTISKIERYKKEICLNLRKDGIIKLTPDYENGILNFEIFLNRKEFVYLSDYLFSVNKNRNDLYCFLGIDSFDNQCWMNLEKNPHLLIAGTTGSGKSSLLHTIIANLLYISIANLYLIDTKQSEFHHYEKSSKVEIAYSYEDALDFINQLIDIMNFRYSKIHEGFNAKQFKPLVLIIDEFADLIMQDKKKELKNKLCKLAQKSRAARIHIVLATQRPSVNIIDGIIKANFPARIACRVVTQVDSRVVMDSNGAEILKGNGDAFLMDNERTMHRFQSAFFDKKFISMLNA